MGTKRFAVTITMAVALAGCAAIERPELTGPDVLPLRVLTEAINCELATAISEQVADNPWIRSWQGQYSITLKANQIAFLKAATNTLPFVLPRASVLNLGLGAGVTTTANRTALYKFNVEFRDVERRPPCRAALRPDGHPFLIGEIGFRSWMARAIEASGDQLAGSAPDKLVSIGHTFEFAVDFNASVSPSFVLMPVPVATINPAASFDRVEDNVVEVSFGKVPSVPASITKVVKTPSLDQRRSIDEARLQRGKELAKAAAARRVLAEPENKAMLDAGDMVAALERQMSSNPLQGFREERPGERRLLTEKLEAARSGVDPKRLGDLRRTQGEVISAEDEARKRTDTIRRIEADPQRTDVTTRQISVPAVGLPPDANPNVSSTLLQLQLERLVGNRFGSL